MRSTLAYHGLEYQAVAPEESRGVKIIAAHEKLRGTVARKATKGFSFVYRRR